MLDEFQFAMSLEQSGVWLDGFHPYALERFGGRDQGIRHRTERQIDHQVVDCESRTAFDDVERQDVCTHRTQSDSQ